MSYIGNPVTTAAFPAENFSGTGSQTAYTMAVAPANTASVFVFISGVKQDPTTYSVNGTTLTFSAAPPSGTNNISVIYMGVPANGVTTTAYRSKTEYTATAGQTTFTPPSYTVGFVDVLRNGVSLGSADYTATNGTTVVLAAAASAGDLITIISFYVSSVLNAIPNSVGSVSNTNLLDGSVSQTKLATGVAGTGPAFLAYQSSSQTISSGTWTKILYNTETNDSNNCYDPSIARFTPTVAGYYMFTFAVAYDSTTAFEHIVALRKNGSNYRVTQDVKIQQWGLNSSAMAYANGTTDYFEVYFYQNSGTSGGPSASEFVTYFTGALVRAA